MIERDSTVLPEPDSPTMPSVLPALERERHAVDGAHETAVGVEVRGDVVDHEQRRVAVAASSGVGSTAIVGHRPPSRTSKRLADDVAEHVEREHGEEDHERGLEHDVRRSVDVLAPDRDHVAPGGRVGLDARAEDAQGALGDDGHRDAEQRDRVHRREHVRQHLAEQDAPVLRALRLGREHELALRPRQRARARDAPEHRDRHDAEGEDQRDLGVEPGARPARAGCVRRIVTSASARITAGMARNTSSTRLTTVSTLPRK